MISGLYIHSRDPGSKGDTKTHLLQPQIVNEGTDTVTVLDTWDSSMKNQKILS